jgi:hypothetical protein
MNTRTALQIVTGLGLAIGMMPQAHAVTGCTNNMLSGAYGWQLSGTLTPDLSGGVGGAATPLKVMARIPTEVPGTVSVAAGFASFFLDGGGNLFGNSAVILDGVWSEGPLTGSYNVNDDCSVSLTLTDSAGGTQHFDGVVVNRGDEATLLQTDKGVGISGSLRHARGSCQTSDILGSFGFRSEGTILATGPFTSIGTINLDGQGNATATESRFSAGAYSQVASTGTITVNTDCTLTLTLSANTDGSLVNFRGMQLNNMKEIFLLRSDDGTAITGHVIAQ